MEVMVWQAASASVIGMKTTFVVVAELIIRHPKNSALFTWLFQLMI